MLAGLCLVVSVVAAEPGGLTPEADRRIESVIGDVEAACRARTIYMVGPEKARRLAELVRQAKPKLVVECGTAIGYSGLWIARELKRAGGGRLVTMEIRPETAREAEANFRRAGVPDLVEVRIGDARQLTARVEGPIDFVLLDCNASNYLPSFLGLEKRLRAGAIVVADNVAVSAGGMQDYLEHVRSRYASRTEWFDLDIPWAKRDAMEITEIAPPKH